MTDVRATALHFDELRDYALRGLENVKPGMEVLVLHVPSLKAPEFAFGQAFPHATQKTIQDVRLATRSELHKTSEDSHDTEAKPVVFFESNEESSLRDYMYATDSGVVPYYGDNGPFFNDSNFLVDVDELARVGIEPNIQEVSLEYKSRAEAFRRLHYLQGNSPLQRLPYPRCLRRTRNS